MIRIIGLFITMMVLMTGLGWALAGVAGMTVALVIALCINMVSYWYSDAIVLRMYKAVPTSDEELSRMAAKLAGEAKVPCPRLYIVPSDVPNAFATGRDPGHSVIAFTKGLLGLEKHEIEAVMAHEMAHIKNRDTLGSMAAATMAGAVSYIAQIGYWSVFMEDRKGEGNLMGLLLIIVFAPVAALMVRFAISRLTEYRADFTAVLLVKNTRALSSALMKIDEIAKNSPMRGPAATSHMWIINPFHVDWFTSLFSTHPTIESRINRLETMGRTGY